MRWQFVDFSGLLGGGGHMDPGLATSFCEITVRY